MIFTTLRNIVIVAGLSLSVAGCTNQQPVYNVVNHHISGASNPLTLDDIQKEIMLAGVDAGWVLTPVEPGQLKGHIDRAGGSADIDVRFTVTSYNISYVDSANLLAMKKGQIHRYYNRWVRLLEENIAHRVARRNIS
jgi:hypothetical protein